MDIVTTSDEDSGEIEVDEDDAPDPNDHLPTPDPPERKTRRSTRIKEKSSQKIGLVSIMAMTLSLLGWNLITNKGQLDSMALKTALPEIQMPMEQILRPERGLSSADIEKLHDIQMMDRIRENGEDEDSRRWDVMEVVLEHRVSTLKRRTATN